MHKIDAADSGILYELEGQDREKISVWIQMQITDQVSESIFSR
jgi:hypothetical protein